MCWSVFYLHLSTSTNYRQPLRVYVCICLCPSVLLLLLLPCHSRRPGNPAFQLQKMLLRFPNSKAEGSAIPISYMHPPDLTHPRPSKPIDPQFPRRSRRRGDATVVEAVRYISPSSTSGLSSSMAITAIITMPQHPIHKAHIVISLHIAILHQVPPIKPRHALHQIGDQLLRYKTMPKIKLRNIRLAHVSFSL